MFLIVLAAISAGAYWYVERSTHELLEPLLLLPEGQAAYTAAMGRTARTILTFDAPLVGLVAIASYVLARLSVGPLAAARRREERFVADAAHELRTPLATIAALAQQARDAGDSAQSRALERIAGVALETSALLGDLLALARDEPDDRRLHEPVDVGALLQTLAREAQDRATVPAIAVTTPPSGAYVNGDARALRQLAANLIANAQRHAHRQVTLGVTLERTAVALFVDDDGDGVANADRERIFERFFKADPAAPGAGLGLAICRRIAARHGGTVVLEGRARFVARFPRLL